MRYQKWIRCNTQSLKEKNVLMVGATGSIGKSVVNYLLSLEANLLIAARNVLKAQKLKESLLLEYPNCNIEIIYLDISDLNSIDDFALKLFAKNYRCDIFINNAGVYNLPSVVSKQGYEIHFATNALGSYYLANKIIKMVNQGGKMLFTSSISYNFSTINFNDFTGICCRNHIKRYGLTKRIMTYLTLDLKKNNHHIGINLVHPGICATELFTKNPSKVYQYLFYPLMKVIFHNADKAALSIIKGCFIETEINEWVGPKVFNIWGKPAVKDMKGYKKLNKMNEVVSLTKKLIGKI